jgi:hypothetical protein
MLSRRMGKTRSVGTLISAISALTRGRGSVFTVRKIAGADARRPVHEDHFTKA